MKVKLLRKVQKHILAEPRRLDMNRLCDYVGTHSDENPPCGTVGCIAGWAHMLTMPEIPMSQDEVDMAEFDALEKASSKLSLTVEQAAHLFTEPKFDKTITSLGEEAAGWPRKFARRYLGAKTARGRAKVTSDRIDHFIKTRGRE